MKLQEYLDKKLWTCAIFSRFSKVHVGLLHKIIKNTGNVTLNTALKIEAATMGEVSVWELSPISKEIMDTFEYLPQKANECDKEKRNENREKKKQYNTVSKDRRKILINY